MRTRNHGTNSLFNDGCRCEPCVQAYRNKRDRMRQRGTLIDRRLATTATCEHCGRSFTTKRHAGNQARYCSTRCRHKQPSRHAEATERLRVAAAGTTPRDSKVWISGYCAVCHDAYTVRQTSLSARTVRTPTCGAACAVAWRTQQTRLQKRLAKDRRRARLRSAYVAPVNPIEIYDRDGWRCHICGDPVSRDDVVPHPLAPTIDHYYPLAHGGTHEPLNCRTAHFLCNAVKNDTILDQLPLFGVTAAVSAA